LKSCNHRYFGVFNPATVKTSTSIFCCLALLFGTGSLHASTPMSADEYLVTPGAYENQTIRLNVAFVRPVRFQSPLQDVMFYNAVTLTADRKPGGEILVAVPKDGSEHFAQSYGMNPRGKNSRILSGTLLLARNPRPSLCKEPNHSPGTATSKVETGGGALKEGTPVKRIDQAGTWFVDYKGLNAAIFNKS
jgi:hypothetical protein